MTALEAGRWLAHYEILTKIGEGGMGEVYRARDTKLGRDVALKVLPSEVATDTMRCPRFEHETRTVAALNHPNIITLHSIEQADDIRFLTMDLVLGETLSSLIGRSVRGSRGQGPDGPAVRRPRHSDRRWHRGSACSRNQTSRPEYPRYSIHSG